MVSDEYISKSKTLAISIPTRNRAGYLKELLASIKSQNFSLDHVKIYVFDNDSTDNTVEILSKSGLNIEYTKNKTNIGADANIFQAYTVPQEDYIWVIGDDELLAKDALGYIFLMINSYYEPHIIICGLSKSKTYKSLVVFPECFSTYRDFVKFAECKNPQLLIAHGLISCNILKKGCFDPTMALERQSTLLGHFYGIVNGLYLSPGSVIIPTQEIIIVRRNRAPPEKPIIDDDGAEVKYLKWVIDLYGLGLDPETIIPVYRKRIRSWYRKCFDFVFHIDNNKNDDKILQVFKQVFKIGIILFLLCLAVILFALHSVNII